MVHHWEATPKGTGNSLPQNHEKGLQKVHPHRPLGKENLDAEEPASGF